MKRNNEIVKHNAVIARVCVTHAIYERKSSLAEKDRPD